MGIYHYNIQQSPPLATMDIHLKTRINHWHNPYEKARFNYVFDQLKPGL